MPARPNEPRDSAAPGPPGPFRGAGRLEVSPYEFAAAARLTAELSCSHVLAQVLVRRGLGEAEAARRFLEAGVAHPLSAWPGLARTAWRGVEHVDRGSRVTPPWGYHGGGGWSAPGPLRAPRAPRAPRPPDPPGPGRT